MNIPTCTVVAGDLDQAVHHGLTALSYDRKTEASLLSHAVDLDQLLSDRYPTSASPPSSTSATETRGQPCTQDTLGQLAAATDAPTRSFSEL
jgi:hypothetical protein